jgi:glucose-6-phosphate 1-dehydrogenase
MRGDATNFTHWDEVALSWKFVDTISNAWENTKDESFPNYEAGSTGPLASDELLEEDGHIWWEIKNNQNDVD